jgi:hypothetical protein
MTLHHQGFFWHDINYFDVVVIVLNIEHIHCFNKQGDHKDTKTPKDRTIQILTKKTRLRPPVSKELHLRFYI